MQVTPLAPDLEGEHNLLAGIRDALDDANEGLLCVAFASAAGVNLIEPVLRKLAARNAARILVTTTFGSSTPEALQRAYEIGAEVRVMNLGRRTFHAKLYLGRREQEVAAIVGSANLTGGIVANVELATKLVGDVDERELALLRAWGEDLWTSDAAVPWEPSGRVEREVLDPVLLQRIREAVSTNAVVTTLGPSARPNRVVEVMPEGVFVETKRSKERGARELVPAWMIQLAWDVLQRSGSLSNRTLLDELRVHRSSFVCALLARLPGVEPMKNPVGVRLATLDGRS